MLMLRTTLQHSAPKQTEEGSVNSIQIFLESRAISGILDERAMVLEV